MSTTELTAIVNAVPPLKLVPTGPGTYECPVCAEGEVDAEEWMDGDRDSGWLAGVMAFGSGKELEATKRFVETFTPSRVQELLTQIEQLTQRAEAAESQLAQAAEAYAVKDGAGTLILRSASLDPEKPMIHAMNTLNESRRDLEAKGFRVHKILVIDKGPQ